MEFRCWLEDMDYDNSTTVHADDEKEAATKYAERICGADPDLYGCFETGKVVLVCSRGSEGPLCKFDVTVEAAPVFTASERGRW